jgi:hypothetical protein
VDQNLETQLTWNKQIPISTNDDLTDMQFDPNLFAARFAIGAGGAFMTIDRINWTRLLHTARPSSLSEATATFYVAFAGRSLVKIPNLLLYVIQ